MKAVSIIRQKMNSAMGKDMLLTFAVQILIMLCGFVVNKMVSIRLDIGDFGQFNVVKRSVAVLSFVMLAGTGIAIPRYMTLYRSRLQFLKARSFLTAALCFVIAVSAVIISVCILFKRQLLTIITGGDDDYLLIITLAYAFSMTLASVLYAYYRGMGSFSKFNISQGVIQTTIIAPILMIPTLTVSNIFLTWTIVTLTITAAISYTEYKRHHWILTRRIHWPDINKQMKVILKYASPRLLGDFFLFSFSAYPVIYIGATRGMTASAYISVGITFVSLSTALFSFLGYVLLPYVTQKIALHEMKEAGRFIQRIMYLYVLIALSICVTFHFFTPLLIHLFFDEKYMAAASLTKIMVLAILPQTIYMLLRNPIDAVSVVPYNTVNLGCSLTLIVVAYLYADTFHAFAWWYVAASSLQAVFAYTVWESLKQKQI